EGAVSYPSGRLPKRKTGPIAEGPGVGAEAGCNCRSGMTKVHLVPNSRPPAPKPSNSIGRREAIPARYQLLSLGVDRICIEGVFCEQQVLACMLDELIREPESKEPNIMDSILLEQFEHRASEPSLEVMVLGRDYRPV